MFFVVPLAFIVGRLCLGSDKTSFVMIGMILCSLFYIGLLASKGIINANKIILYFVVASVPFPFLMQFMGRDALTITTFLIYFVFFTIILTKAFNREIYHFESGFVFKIPILIGVVLTLSLILNPIILEQSVRVYVANISGILLFFIIMLVIKENSEIVKIIQIILISLIAQCVITFLQNKYHGVANLLIGPFETRTGFGVSQIVEGINRATGTIWDYELLGEWFLIGSILSIGLIFQKQRYLYILPLFCCVIGMFFTKTRSALMLFFAAFIFISLLLSCFKKNQGAKSQKIALIIAIGLILAILIFRSQMTGSLLRLKQYFQSGNLISAQSINRQDVWSNAARIVLSKPTLFGSGLFNIDSPTVGGSSFHSLYWTLLFKVGIIGFSFYIIFWLKMLRRAWKYILLHKNSENWYLVFFLFISVTFMLVDNIKIEYVRYAHTIQFAWLLYGLLIVATQQNKKEQ